MCRQDGSEMANDVKSMFLYIPSSVQCAFFVLVSMLFRILCWPHLQIQVFMCGGSSSYVVNDKVGKF